MAIITPFTTIILYFQKFRYHNGITISVMLLNYSLTVVSNFNEIFHPFIRYPYKPLSHRYDDP